MFTENVLQIGETVHSGMLGIKEQFSALHSVQHVILEYGSGWEILMVLLSRKFLGVRKNSTYDCITFDFGTTIKSFPFLLKNLVLRNFRWPGNRQKNKRRK